MLVAVCRLKLSIMSGSSLLLCPPRTLGGVGVEVGGGRGEYRLSPVLVAASAVGVAVAAVEMGEAEVGMEPGDWDSNRHLT